MAARYRILPGFWPGTAGKLFVLTLEPQAACNGIVFIVPPFAEELNRSRRTMFRLAVQSACAGYRVISADLFGTGDSDGNFGDASWEIWCEDLVQLVAQQVPVASNEKIAVVAVRLGALLALDVLSKSERSVSKLVLWQPVTNGSRYISQFLRLRTMSEKLFQSGNGETVGELRDRLAKGNSLEVAGYELTPMLADSIAALDIRDSFFNRDTSIAWIDIVGNPSARPPASSEQLVAEIEERGARVELTAMHSPQFWATPEIVVAEELVDATTRRLIEV